VLFVLFPQHVVNPLDINELPMDQRYDAHQAAQASQAADNTSKGRRPSLAGYMEKSEEVEKYVRRLKIANIVTLSLTAIILGMSAYLGFAVEQFSSQLKTILQVLVVFCVGGAVGVAVSMLGQKTVAHDIAQEVRLSHSAEQGAKYVVGWWCGVIGVVGCGGVVVWWCGGVVVWWCGGVVVLWCCGAIFLTQAVALIVFIFVLLVPFGGTLST
jgi:hypothetical protein